MGSCYFRSARISILINGAPKGYFPCSRGIRQGDPLSPLIFCLAEDYLNRRLSQLFADSSLVPMYASSRVFCPSHFLYADDILIFCRASRTNIHKIASVFESYGAISGQVVNWSKSIIYFGRYVSLHRSHMLGSIAGMQKGNLPLHYLGVPLFQGAPKKGWLQPLADKVLSKFDNWKGKLLSMAGRVALVNSVIYGSFLHSFMVYKWPTSLLRRMEKAIRNFI